MLPTLHIKEQGKRRMPSKAKVLDDIARVAGGAASMVSGIAQQVREEVRSRVDELAVKMDWVPREDFERLESRVAALESALKTQNFPKKREKLAKKTIKTTSISKKMTKPTKKTTIRTKKA